MQAARQKADQAASARDAAAARCVRELDAASRAGIDTRNLTQTDAEGPPPAAPAESGWLSALGHTVLDVAGMVPLVGEVADGIDAAWYTAEGDYTNAALSAAAMVLFLGTAASAAKLVCGGSGIVRGVDPAPGPNTPLAPQGGLQRHEDAGGHTLAPHKAHVGATDQQILNRLAQGPNLPGVSSYYDRATAERAVSENIAANSTKIQQWLQSSAPKIALPWPLCSPRIQQYHRYLRRLWVARRTTPRQFDARWIPHPDILPAAVTPLEASRPMILPDDQINPDQPEISQLAGYLHQDWNDEYDDVWDAVRDFCSEQSAEEVHRSADQVHRLLENELDEKQLMDATVKLGIYYYPPREGLTYRGWLRDLEALLRSKS